jgi:gliding motility-associated-like protein
MKYHFLLILFIAFFNKLSKSQVNLVKNYSFEQYNLCPNDMTQLTPSCSYWYDTMSKMKIIPPFPYSNNNWGSSEYYHICAINTAVHIPQNFCGFQIAHYGSAYCGFLLTFYINNQLSNYKEYIGTELYYSLNQNRSYQLEFYYSIAEYSYDQLEYYPLEIGALLTDTVVYQLSGISTNQPQNIITNPQVKQQLPEIKDTLNWIKVSGTFVANGGERFLTIGSFQNTGTLANKNVYVYIDDVKLWELEEQPTQVDSLKIPNIITPNTDGINDKFMYENQDQWSFETKIFSRWGNLVYDNKSSENWDGTYKGQIVSQGVYYYVIKAQAIKNGEVRIHKGTVTVMY